MNPLDLTKQPSTDPTSIYRQRDGLYATDLLTAGLVGLDLFTWLGKNPADAATICRAFELQKRPADVMLTLFTAMGFLQRQDAVFSLTPLAREHLVKESPWYIGPYYASLKERPVCKDMLAVLRTGKAANWGSLKDEKAWAQAMEDDAFAAQFTAAMDCRGIYLGRAMATSLDLGSIVAFWTSRGSGIYACCVVATHGHILQPFSRNRPSTRSRPNDRAARLRRPCFRRRRRYVCGRFTGGVRCSSVFECPS